MQQRYNPATVLLGIYPIEIKAVSTQTPVDEYGTLFSIVQTAHIDFPHWMNG